MLLEQWRKERMSSKDEALTCPDCDSACPTAENYDRDCKFNSWKCECNCGLTCLGNSPDEVRATWRNIVIGKWKELV